MILARTTQTNSKEGKPDLVVDQDQQYKMTLKVESKADWTLRDRSLSIAGGGRGFDDKQSEI